jgi:hypothetical protein
VVDVLVGTLIATFVAGWFAAIVVWVIGIRAYRLWVRRMIGRAELPAWVLGAVPPFRGLQPIPATEFNRFGMWPPLWAAMKSPHPDLETERLRQRVMRRGRVFVGIWVAMLVDFALIVVVGSLTGTFE